MFVVKTVSAYLIFSSIIFEVLYRAQPTAFIDEIFHISQVQKYCSGIFNEVQHTDTIN